MTIQSLIIDSREPNWMQTLRFDGVQTVVATLDAGDIWLATPAGELLVIERKTTADLLSSIADGRLLDQAGRMRDVTPWAYIVVQGHFVPDADGMTYASGTATRWRWASLQGALQTVQELGVVIVYIDDTPAAMRDYLVRLAARERSAVRLGAPRRSEMHDPSMLPLIGLPGIGDERAKTLIETFGSAAWALEYLSDPEWNGETHAPGIGPGVKDRVRAALGLAPDMKLCIRSLQE